MSKQTKTKKNKRKVAASNGTASQRSAPAVRTVPKRPTPTRARRSSGSSARGRTAKLWWYLALAIGVIAVLLFLTRQGGEEVTGLAVTGGDLHSLVVAPDDPSRLYVGGHASVAMSRDAGASWQQVASLDDADAMGWAFADGRVFVGGHPGLSVSEDGGETFELRNQGLPVTDLHGLGGSENVLYASSPAIGVIASSDGGRTWEVRTTQAGQSFMGALLVDPKDPDHVVAPDMRLGTVESIDGGRTWRRLGGAEGAMWVSWDRTHTSTLVVSGVEGAAISSDGGASWEDMDTPSGTSIVEVAPGGDTLFAAVHKAPNVEVWVTRDGGRQWEPTIRPSPIAR